jgi:phage terminase large subunit
METRKERDPQGYKIYGLNEWGDLDGLIFTDYSVKDFDRKAITDRAYGQDFGYSHANAILDVGFSLDDIYVCDEIYVTERDTVEIIELANAKGLDRRRVMYCDSAEPDRIKMWRKAGYNAVAVSKEKNSVQGQIEWIKGNGEKGRTVKRTIYIHPDCVNTIKEIGQWSRKKDMKTNTFTEEPVDAFDDAMAALRYSVEGKRKPKALPFVL